MKRLTGLLPLGMSLAAMLACTALWSGESRQAAGSAVAPSSRAPARAPESIPLSAGCNNVALTWPSGTPLRVVAASLSPLASLVAIWRHEPALGRFAAFSPFHNAPVDYRTVGVRLEPAMVCLNAPATLARPAISAQEELRGSGPPFGLGATPGERACQPNRWDSRINAATVGQQ
jgi:hypothetical protein